MGNKAFNMGPIRPPSEANSLLLRVTEGCTWNKCKFCSVYRDTKFKIYQVEDIKQDIDAMAAFRDRIVGHINSEGRVDHNAIIREMQMLPSEEQNCYYVVYNWLMNGGKSVFLQDGNSVALKPEKLAEVLFYLREKFPHIERITSYARAETLARHSVEQLKLLRESGLDRVHSGYESGSDKILTKINKGLTQEQQIIAGRKVKEAGMELSVYFMPGIGGVELSDENATETAYVISQIDPDFVRLRTFVVKDGSEMWDDFIRGDFVECDDFKKLEEIRKLILNVKDCHGVLVSDHIINLIGSLTGHFDNDKESMLMTIDKLFAMPERERKIYQLARRMGQLEGPEQLPGLVPQQRSKYEAIIDSIKDEDEWNKMIDGILRNYI